MKLHACLALVVLIASVLADATCPPGTGGKDCEPCRDGTYSVDGTGCVACPIQAMCLSMPMSCQRMPPCHKTTGEATSMCWVDKPDGTACKPELYGDEQLPPGPVTHTCKAGECIKAATDKPGPSKACSQGPFCRRGRMPCEQKPKCINGRHTSRCWQASPNGTPCNPSRFNPEPLAGWTCHKRKCVKTQQETSPKPPAACPDVPMCRKEGFVCEMAPPCDADGKPTEMCWVEKPDGTGCKDAAGKPGFCTGPATCEVSQGVLNPGEGNCPSLPMCKRMGGVCEQAPLCDGSGKPAGMCWVPKPNDVACAENGVSGTCKNGQCRV